METKTSSLSAKVAVRVSAPIEKVWAALTEPELVKQYLFGTDLITDWKIGSPIVYKGTWDGKAYEDKGRVLEFVPPTKIRTSYWTAFSGMPDSPENYQLVTYELHGRGNHTVLTITQDNIATEEARNHTAQSWCQVMDGMKKMLGTARGL